MELIQRIHALFMGRYLQDALEAGIKEYNGVPIAQHLENVWQETEKEYNDKENGCIDCFTVFDNNFLLGAVIYLKNDDGDIYIKHFLWVGNFKDAKKVYNIFYAFSKDPRGPNIYMRCNKQVVAYDDLAKFIGMRECKPINFPWGNIDDQAYNYYKDFVSTN